MKVTKPFQIAILCFLSAVYFAVRVWGLSDSCLWFDEIFSVHAAQHEWREILSFVALDLIHPPFFYVLLKLWITAGGDGLLWLRLFPVICSVLAVFPFLWLCKELKVSFWTRVLSLFFLAVNGSLIKYSQEVRMYSLLMCLSLYSIWLFSRYFIKGKSFVPLLIINILMIYTHYFGWLIVIAEVFLIIWFQRIKWRRMAVMAAVLAAAFLPWVIAVLQAAQTGTGIGQNIGWMSRPGIAAIFQFKLALIEPFYYQASSIDPVSIFRVSVPLILIIAVAFFFLLKDWNSHPPDDRRALYLLGIFAVVPVLIALPASWALPYSIWGTRHLVIVFAPVAILLALAISMIRIPSVKASVVTLILLFAGYASFLKFESGPKLYSWCAWEPLSSQTNIGNNESIYTFEDLVAYHLWFAEKQALSPAKIFKVTNIDGLTEDKAYFLPRGFEGVGQKDLADINEPRIWIAFRSGSLRESEPPLRNFLVKGYRVTDRRTLTGEGESSNLILLEK